MSLPTCTFCAKPITTLDDGYLEFFEHAHRLLPPSPESVPVALYAHADCGPECGYNIQFARLLRDGVGDEPSSWYVHLRSKRWFTPPCAADLDDAYEAAQRVKAHMERSITPMRSVVASIPRRPPRTPDNPRNIRPAMRARVMERDGFKCRRCGCGPNDSPLVVDHIIPVAKGGTGAFDNLQTLCRICNAGKSDAAPHAHDLRAGA